MAILNGGEGNDSIIGTNSNDTINGRGGDDYLNGGAGDDQLEGGTGNNVLTGGLGNDTYFYAYQSTDTVSDSGGSNDTLYVTARDQDGVRYFGDSYVQNGNLVLVSRQDSAKSLTVENAFTADGRIENITFHADNGAFDDLDYRISSLDDNFTGENILYFGTRSDDILVMNDGYNEAVLSAGNDTVTMGNGGGWVFGGDGDDTITGGDGNDYILGEAGDDTLSGGYGDDKVWGEAGNDILYMDAGNDTLDGGTGTDWLYVTGSTNSVVNLAKMTGQNTGYGTDIIQNIEHASGGSGVDKFYGTGGNNTLKGNNGNDVLSGKNGNDKLYGGNNSDKLYGGSGNDLLKGDAGRDTLQGDAGKDRMFGGSGADKFVFRITSDSNAASSKADVIKDFKHGVDHIDLRSIDASTIISGNNAFTFDGTTQFGTSKSGDIYYEKFNLAGTSRDYTMVYIDNDADRGVEMSIRLDGLINLTAGDFLL